MFRKIKEWFSLQKRIQIEILETLCTICLFLEFNQPRNRYSEFMHSHVSSLKGLSDELRKR